MTEAVIVSAARTPFGAFGGGLREFSATDLGGLAIKEAVARAGLKGPEIDNAFMGRRPSRRDCRWRFRPRPSTRSAPRASGR